MEANLEVRISVLENRMKAYLRRNRDFMDRVHNTVSVEKNVLTQLDVQNFSENNLKAIAANDVLAAISEPEYLAEFLEFKLKAEMSSAGSHEALAILIEAHQILAGE